MRKEPERRIQSQNKESKTGFIPVEGINCITISGSTPFFFLFAEIDDKELDHVRRVLKYFAKNKLSVYWFETSKGFHFISPCLLTLEQWIRIKYPLIKILENYYECINLRWSSKPTDPATSFLNYNIFNDDNDFDESLSLHKLIWRKFDSIFKLYGVTLHDTIIRFVEYEEFMLDGVF